MQAGVIYLFILYTLSLSYGLHILQGSYPRVSNSVRSPVNWPRLLSLILPTLEQAGSWNFLELVFKT